MAKFKKTNFKSKVGKNVERQKTENTGFGYLRLPKGIQMFKEKEGKFFLDFIPYIVKSEKHLDRDSENDIAVPGTLWYRMPFKIHKNVGSNNETVVCPTTFGKKCPICEYRQKRKDAGADQDELKALNVSRRNLYAVIPLKDSKLEEKIHIWDVSNFLFQELLNEELNENEDYYAFPGIEDGLTLKIRFEEEVFNKNKFYRAGRIDFLERKKQYKESIIDSVPCLEELLVVQEYKQLEALFHQIDDDVDVDDDDNIEEDDEETKSTRRKKSAKPSKRQEEEEDDDSEEEEEEEDDEEDDSEEEEDDEDEDEEEEEDEDEESDEEDEDDEEDDDEDEAPAKKKGKALQRKKSSKKQEPEEEEEDDDDEDDEDDEDEEETPALKLPKDLVQLMNWTVSYKGKKGIVSGVTPGERSCSVKITETGKVKVGVPISKLTLLKAFTPPVGPRPGKESPKKDYAKHEKEKGKSKENKCPHGHTYFKDNDKKNACKTCKVWDACVDNE